MTKKRFKKLVMSYGIQRNEAEVMSEYVLEYGSYDAVFGNNKFSLAIGSATLALVRFARLAVKVLKEVDNQLSHAVCMGVDFGTEPDQTVENYCRCIHTDKCGTVQTMTHEEHLEAHNFGKGVSYDGSER